MFERLFRRNRKPADPKAAAEEARQQRQVEEARRRAELDMARQKSEIQNYLPPHP
jgi:hypothetical protein